MNEFQMTLRLIEAQIVGAYLDYSHVFTQRLVSDLPQAVGLDDPVDEVSACACILVWTAGQQLFGLSQNGMNVGSHPILFIMCIRDQRIAREKCNELPARE